MPAVRMIETGDYVVPKVGSEPYLRKPPLIMLGKEDVPCVAAIHHPFGHVDSGAREIGPFVYIDHPR